MYASDSDKGEKLNAPVPKAIRDVVKKALKLSESDQFEEAIAELKRAISLAPHYLQPYSEYIRIKTYMLDKYDEVRAEYESLMAKEPDNPIYPMAFAMGQFISPDKSAWFKRVAELAPDWAWGHLAKAALIEHKEPEKALAELQECIEKDKTAEMAYNMMIYILGEKLGKIDDAISIAEKMATQPDLRASGPAWLWNLRYTKAQGSKEFCASLKNELMKIADASRDIDILMSIYRTFSFPLKDHEGARVIEDKIRRIDPNWYPERGHGIYIANSNLSGIPRQVIAGNHQYEIFTKMDEISDDLVAKEKMARLEKLLRLKPSAGIKWLINKKLFLEAEKTEDIDAIVKYGEALYVIDPTDTAVLSKMSIALAERKRDLKKALHYARQAEESTVEFKPAQRPANTDEGWFKYYSQEYWQKNYNKQRSLALHALGLALSQMGNYSEAEAKLRQSIELERSEKKLSHLAEVLRHLGRQEEAQKLFSEAEKEWVESIKRRFTSEPAKDFELESIDGRKYRLSDFKGKVVMLNFWATWCGPCAKEMPHLVEMYEKNKDRGFEILAISVDSKPDRYKVAPFVKKYKMTFTALFDEGVSALYKVDGYPTNIFIDKQGNVRYRQFGFDEQTPHIQEVVINELLK
jgi:thiol-disulfide isomerase/thioredoxin